MRVMANLSPILCSGSVCLQTTPTLLPASTRVEFIMRAAMLAAVLNYGKDAGAGCAAGHSGRLQRRDKLLLSPNLAPHQNPRIAAL